MRQKSSNSHAVSAQQARGLIGTIATGQPIARIPRLLETLDKLDHASADTLRAAYVELWLYGIDSPDGPDMASNMEDDLVYAIELALPDGFFCEEIQGGEIVIYEDALSDDDFDVDYWSERDRLYVGLKNTREDKTVADWWDEDARQLFEDGFFDSRRLRKSVIEYAVSLGIISLGGK